MSNALAMALYYHLTTTATAVAALCGVRAYPRERVPSGAAAPYLVYFQVSAVHLRDAEGGEGVCNARVQVDGWCDSADDARSLSDALRAACDNFSGTMGGGGNTITVKHCALLDDADAQHAAFPGAESGFIGISHDYMVVYNESITP